MFSEKLSQRSQNIVRSSEGGTAMVEFAIVLPLLLLLVFGMIEFGLLIYNKQILTNASREGARAGIVQASPPGVTQTPNRYTKAQIEQVVMDYCSNYLITFSNENVKPKFESIDSGYVDHCSSSSEPEKLQIKLKYDYNFLVLPNIIINLFNGVIEDPIPLRATTIMLCE